MDRLISWIGTCSRGRLVLTLLGIFGVAHAFYLLMGVTFDASPLRDFMHYLDVELLRHRLGESLLYLHSQPPLFNLYLGVVLKLFPSHYRVAFYLTFLAMGFACYVTLFRLLRVAGLPRLLSLLLATWFVVSPSFILYEHWLFYSLPELLLVTVIALLFYEVVVREKGAPLAAFFWTLALLCLLRSLFHLVCLLVAVVVIVLLKREQWRRVLVAASLPVLLVGALYAKNFALFGQFSPGAWMGIGLKHVVIAPLSDQERAKLFAEKKLSLVTGTQRTWGHITYPREYFRVPPRFARIPAVAQEYRSTGVMNFNHYGWLLISRDYTKDAFWLARHRPILLLEGWLSAWACYFRSSSDYWLLPNREKIECPRTFWDVVFYGNWPESVRLGDLPIYNTIGCEPELCVFLLIGLPWLLWRGVHLGWRGDPRLPLTRAQRLLILWACGTILYVALVGNCLDAGENNRFRFATDPLYLLLLGLVIQARWGKALAELGTESLAAAS